MSHWLLTCILCSLQYCRGSMTLQVMLCTCCVNCDYYSLTYLEFIAFLANVNMLSPVRLSSVMFVRPTQAVQIFGNISTPLGTLAIHWHPSVLLTTDLKSQFCVMDIASVWHSVKSWHQTFFLFMQSTVNVSCICICDLGYGIFATRDFDHHEFLLEYCGILIDPLTADGLFDQTFLYYFDKGRQSYW